MGLLEPHGRYRRRDGEAHLMGFRTLDDMGDLAGKRVLVREDLNVPMQGGVISDDTRLRATVETLCELSDRGAIVLILAHFGRPNGERNPAYSLEPVAVPLSAVLGRPVQFVADCVNEIAETAIAAMKQGEIALLENTRFHGGEEVNRERLILGMAKLADFYVNDAFSAAHRAHASTEGLAHVLPAFAGRAMQAELSALEKALGAPQKPVAAVVGGAKVSTKLDVLKHLVARVDHLIIGGGMANTFLAARGVDVGKSLCEHDLAETANAILDAADAVGCTVHLPYDVVVAKEFRENPPIRTVNVHEVAADEMILDVGPAAVEALADVLKTCRTLVWNGPMALAKTAAALTKEGSLVSVAGGGDTVAALNHAGVADDFTFVSTAGGAFLEWMEGRELPGVAALQC
jgi:phosphoglycerate kinase